MKFILSIIFFVIFFSISTTQAQYSKKSKGTRVTLVDVTNVQNKNIEEKTSAIGRLVALNPIIVSSKINQEILKIHFKIGGEIKKNDILFTLDSKSILRNIKRISAEIKYEEDTLNFLKKKLELRASKANNAKYLRSQNIITQDNLDNVEIALIQNQQEISQRIYNIKKLRILLDENKENLNYTKILSPVNGNIIDINSQVGAVIPKGKVLASILEDGFYEIETDLRADIASKVRVGSSVDIINNQQKFSGKIRGIVNSENIRTGTRKIRISVGKSLPKNLTASGTRFSLEISVGNNLKRVLIPKDALTPIGERQFVYLYDKGLAKRKFVKTGISVGDNIEILNGLKEGEKVVIKGNENLRPNQPIKIKKKR
jgi:RND family efflux transporter MFP subunit